MASKEPVDPLILRLQAEIDNLEAKWAEIEDKIIALEGYAVSDHSRLKDLEEWQEEVESFYKFEE